MRFPLQIFLINACRGGRHNLITKLCEICKLSLDGGNGNGSDDAHMTDDCFVWYSTKKDFVSYRNPQGGSVFIQKVSQVRKKSFVSFRCRTSAM